jgi:hypothetical protein
MKRVLLVTYGGGHVAMMLPIIRELKRRGNCHMTVLGLTTAGPRLQQEGIPYLGFADLVEPYDEDALEKGRQLAAENHTQGTGIPFSETVAYLGLSYADLVERSGIEGAEKEYAERKRQAFLPVGPLKRLIARVQPDLVLATSSPRAERAAIIAAQTMRIPAVSIIDLFGREWSFLFQPGYADRVLVMSEMVRQDFIGRGRHPDEILVTGNPSFDRLTAPSISRDARRWRESVDPHGNRKVVLWTATSVLTDPDRREVLRSLGELAASRPDLAIVYRPHPNAVADFSGLPPGIMPANNREDCAAQIAGSDVVLVTVSTTGIEAALLDKPVIKMSFVNPTYRIYADAYPKYDVMAPYETMNIAHRIEALEQLEEVIDDVTSPTSPNAERLRLARAALPSAGGSAERVVDALENAMQADQFRRVA